MLGEKKIALALIVAFATSLALAAPPAGKGGGGGGGGSGGGGGGGTGVDVYAEMVEIDRDVNGVPILTWALGPKDKYTWVRSPIMFADKDDCPLEFESLAAVAGHSIYAHLDIDARYIPFVDGEIPVEYEPCMTEAHLGRLNAVRAPAKVLDMALLELVTALKTPGVTIGLDDAGRLSISYYDDVLEVNVVKTIDAPRENLAGFESLLEKAELSHAEVAGGAVTGLPMRPDRSGRPDRQALELMDRAAAMLGAASDKFGVVGLDELMYVSEILTIGPDMNAAAKDLFGSPFVQPEDPTGRTSYFNFSKFKYNRAATYAGDVCYLKVSSPDGPPLGGETLPVDVTGQIVKEPIFELVFGNENFEHDNVWGFARAVDDARAVIYFVHEHPVPAELLGYCDLDNANGQ
ncbi:MAG: hypothetical protein ACNA8G_12380 [Gammaproteobacteria bacterium]